MPQPHKIADVLSELLTRRGLGRVQATRELNQAWRAAAGDLLAEHSRVGNVRRGVLEVFVANSTLLQEMSFRKRDLLKNLADNLPDHAIKDLKFRLAADA